MSESIADDRDYQIMGYIRTRLPEMKRVPTSEHSINYPLLAMVWKYKFSDNSAYELMVNENRTQLFYIDGKNIDRVLDTRSYTAYALITEIRRLIKLRADKYQRKYTELKKLLRTEVRREK